MPDRPLKVSVLVDLALRADSGGHVKYWERVAAAAAAAKDGGDIDLTVHFQGRRPPMDIAPHVHYRFHPPMLSTARLPFLEDMPDSTDLAPVNPTLLRALARADVIHTTDAFFAFAKTAALAHRLWRRPLVTSVHTDTPSYTRHYSARTFRRLFGSGALGRWLIERVNLPERMGRTMDRKLLRHMSACGWVLPTRIGDDWPPALRARTSFLRRGIDRELFNPARRDRDRLARTHAIPPALPVLLFVGRLDSGKSVMTLARAARQLIDGGRALHVLFAGEGADAAAIAELLGPHASLPGTVDPDTLGWLYASADLFVFPSQIETGPNVVLEAKASGLPVVVAPGGGGRQVVRPGGDGIVVADTDPAAWAAAVAELIDHPDRRAAVGAAGLADLTRRYPSWREVLCEDLIPVWRSVAAAPARA